MSLRVDAEAHTCRNNPVGLLPGLASEPAALWGAAVSIAAGPPYRCAGKSDWGPGISARTLWRAFERYAVSLVVRLAVARTWSRTAPPAPTNRASDLATPSGCACDRARLAHGGSAHRVRVVGLDCSHRGGVHVVELPVSDRSDKPPHGQRRQHDHQRRPADQPQPLVVARLGAP